MQAVRQDTAQVTSENVGFARRAYEAWNEGGPESIKPFMAEDFEFHDPPDLPDPRVVRGRDAWWESMLGIAPDFSTEVEDVRDLGDMTVARAHIRGHGIGSGASMEQTLWQVAEWRQKKCVRWRTFASEAEALEAAGLSE